jgi:hypothetical protein
MFMSLMILIPFPVFGAGQVSESYMEPFQKNLMASFIGKLAADGKSATPRQRAMFMGYILNRQAGTIGEFETDKMRMSSLVAEVREFLRSVSPGEDLWPVVVAGKRGEFRQEVDALLGGSPYVEPIFPTRDNMVRDWRQYDYSPDRYNRYPDNQAVLNVALTFLQLLKEKRYQEALQLAGGRCYRQFNEALAENASSPEKADEFNRFFESLEWKAGPAGMTDTNPPLAQIMFSLRDPKGRWEEDPCIMILDNGRWKVARFID